MTQTIDPVPRAAYASLAELRAVQARLGELRRKTGDGAALWDAADDFVRRGAATGVVLDSDDERWSVQGLLDYWAAALERAGRPRGDSSLAEFDPEQAPELVDAVCPYLGLNAFEEASGHLFFGREALVARLVQQLAEHRLVALVGPSGSGKSSLVFAGLLRGLRQGALPGSARWRILPPMVPGEAPRAALASRVTGDDGDAVRVLVVDQFEELFTMCESDDERAGFVADLLALVSAPSPPHRVVLTVRSDFESFVARHPALYERYAAGRVAVTPPSAAELRQAIEAPAALVGLKFEAGVIDRLLQELLGEPAGLPLLQFTLLRLWEDRHRNRVTAAIYDRVGGGRQALARTADAIYDAMLPEDQATARRIFLMVGLAVDDRHEATRTRVARARFFEHGDDPGRVERVLDRLLEARLVRQTAGALDGQPRVEVAHEALVRNWPRLAEWLQEAQTSLAERRRFEAKAREWVRLGRGKSAVMDEVELREARRWLDDAARLGLRPSADLLALIARSEQRVAALARRHRFMIARLIVSAGVLAVMLVITWLQYQAARRAHAHELAIEQQRQLDTTRLLGMASMEQGRELLLDGVVTHPMRALTYLVEARTLGIETPTLCTLFAQAARSTPLVTLIGHAAAVNQAVFSPDGARVVTASDDRTARVWDARTGAPVTPPLRHQAAVTAVAFSLDGTRVVTASDDTVARIWDTRTGALMTPPLVHQDAVAIVAFSPDGKRVVTASKSRELRVWDATTGATLLSWRVPDGSIEAAMFSPDGAQVITVSGGHTVLAWDATSASPIARLVARERVAATRVVALGKERTARVWDARTGQPLTALLWHQSGITAAAFSPDGTRVVTASDDRTARVWDARTGEPVTSSLEHEGRVTTAAFSPDGTRVVTASFDNTARVWDAMTGRPISAPLEHQGRIRSAGFSPDGTRVVTAGDDDSARIWDARTGAPVSLVLHIRDDDPAPARPDRDAAAPRAGWIASGGQPMVMFDGAGPAPEPAAPAAVDGAPEARPQDRSLSAAFSPDGTRVIMEDETDALRVWDATTGLPVTAPLPHRGQVLAAAFSPDGSRVVTAGVDGTARIWNAATGTPVTAPLLHHGQVVAAMFSPDGARVMTASVDGTARVWDAVTGKLAIALDHQAAVLAAAYSRDGRRVVTASDDDTAQVWDAATGKPVTGPLSHRGSVTAAAFSPDGRRVVTASIDDTAQVWDAATGKPVTGPLSHRGSVTAAVFSPDGARLVTASGDSTARIWDAATGKPLTAPLEHQGAVMAAEFSADGTRVVTASEDRTARVWDAVSGRPVTAPLQHRGRLFAAAFSPDGTRVVTASGSLHGRIWELPIDRGSLDDWQQIARCSPFALVDGVFTANPALRAVCERRGRPDPR
jgi:WD40 repeat protein